MSRIIRLTDASFEAKVLVAAQPVLVEFWGSWCPPCKMMEPVLAQLAAQYEGRLRVTKINTDQNPRTAACYTIQGVPTFIVFSAGQVRGRRVGAQSPDQLRALLGEARVLEPPSEEVPPTVSGLEAGKDQAEDEEQILERLRALGYVD
jgi:thioredoxin 1